MPRRLRRVPGRRPAPEPHEVRRIFAQIHPDPVHRVRLENALRFIDERAQRIAQRGIRQVPRPYLPDQHPGWRYCRLALRCQGWIARHEHMVAVEPELPAAQLGAQLLI